MLMMKLADLLGIGS
jgi:hypothetical protein